MSDQDYYTILGLRRDASTEEIKVAIARLQRMAAPSEAKTISPSLFKESNEMSRILLDPEARKEYDQYLDAFENVKYRDRYGQGIALYASGRAKRLNEDGGPFLPQLVPPPELLNVEQVIDIKNNVEGLSRRRKPMMSLLTQLSRRGSSYFIPNIVFKHSAPIIGAIAMLYYIITAFALTNFAEFKTEEGEIVLLSYYGNIVILLLVSFLALKSHVTLKKPFAWGYGIVFLTAMLISIGIWQISHIISILGAIPVFFIFAFAYTLRGRISRTKHTKYNFPLDVMSQGDREYGVPGEGILNAARSGHKSFTSVQQQAYAENLTAEIIEPLKAVYPTMQVIHDLHVKGISSGHINHALVVGEKVLFISSKLYEPAEYSLDRWGNIHKIKYNGKFIEPTHRSLSFGKAVDFAAQHAQHARMFGLIIIHPSLTGEIKITGDESAHVDAVIAKDAISYICEYFSDARHDLYDARVMAEVMQYYQEVVSEPISQQFSNI